MTRVYRYQFTKKERDYMINTLLDQIVLRGYFQTFLNKHELQHFEQKLLAWKNSKRGPTPDHKRIKGKWVK